MEPTPVNKPYFKRCKNVAFNFTFPLDIADNNSTDNDDDDVDDIFND